jgi:hypothetical protein
MIGGGMFLALLIWQLVNYIRGKGGLAAAGRAANLTPPPPNEVRVRRIRRGEREVEYFPPGATVDEALGRIITTPTELPPGYDIRFHECDKCKGLAKERDEARAMVEKLTRELAELKKENA